MNIENEFGILYYQTTKFVYVLTLHSLSIGCRALLSKSNYRVRGLPTFRPSFSTPRFHTALAGYPPSWDLPRPLRGWMPSKSTSQVPSRSAAQFAIPVAGNLPQLNVLSKFFWTAPAPTPAPAPKVWEYLCADESFQNESCAYDHFDLQLWQ